MNKINAITSELQSEVELLKTSSRPKIVFIGGVPGAGKSLLIKKAQVDFENDEFSIIEPDLYRKYFKEAKSVEETVESTNKIELNLLCYALKNKKNIIHISSLRAFEYINKLINEVILPLGYDVYLYVIVTNEIESALSTYERYIYDKQNKEPFPRINRYEYLMNANKSFKQAIAFFSTKGYFKNISLFKRGKEMSLPIKLNKLSDNIVRLAEEEEKRQISELDFNKIYSRINDVKKNLSLTSELEEFEKVVNGIIYRFKDRNIDSR